MLRCVSGCGTSQLQPVRGDCMSWVCWYSSYDWSSRKHRKGKTYPGKHGRKLCKWPLVLVWDEWDPLVWVWDPLVRVSERLWDPVTGHVLITISGSLCNVNREMFRAENKAVKVALEESKQVFRVEELQDQQKRWSTATFCKFSFRVWWTDIDNATQVF